MWLKKPVSVVRSKSKIAILLILNVVILGELMQVKQVKGGEYNFDYIDDYKKEAKEYVGETGKGDLAGKVKELEGYTDKPKEVGYSEHELRSKGDARVKGEEKDENEGVREAIGAAKSSYAENPHRSSYTVGKLQHEEFIKKSDAVTSNPISGLNVEGKTECKIADKNIGGENVEFEEYYVDVEDSRLIREDKKCEEDEDRLFYCIRKIKDVKCKNQLDCGYNAGGIEEGSVDTGIEWNYTYPYLRLGSKTGDWHFHGYKGSCDKITLRARFRVKDLNNVKKFKLHQISYDDHAMVRINGNIVHNTLSGYYLDITNRRYNSDRPGRADLIISSGSNSGPCWRLYPTNGQNHYDYVGKDAGSYLREGWNEIEIELVYSWEGQVNVVFEAEQYCCKEWSDEWDGDCPL